MDRKLQRPTAESDQDDSGVTPPRKRSRWGQVTSSTPSSFSASGVVAPPPAAPGLSKQDIETRVAAAHSILQSASGNPQWSLNSNVRNILESLSGRLPLVLNRAQALQAGGTSALRPSRMLETNFDAMKPAAETTTVSGSSRLLPKHATLKINRSLASRPGKQLKQSFKCLTDPTQNPNFDPTLKSGSKFKKGALRFIESGFYVRKQQMIERKQKREGGETIDALASQPQENVEPEKALADRARVIAENFIGARRRRKHLQRSFWSKHDVPLEDEEKDLIGRQAPIPMQGKRDDIFPELEWWDLEIVDKLTEEELDSQSRSMEEPSNLGIPYKLRENVVTQLIEHPVPVEPIAEKDPSLVVNMIFLTEEEKKRMRRQHRREKEQEKRDKIRMGLIPPDAPKVKLSNLMRVLGQEAVANPTKVETQVRKQVAQRLQAHQEHNEQKRLTKEKKAEKTRQKWLQRDETNVQLTVAVFQLGNVTNRSHLFKIHQNARQMFLSGIAVLCPGVGNLVMVEGGPRSVKKYKALMLRRIQWGKNEDDILLGGKAVNGVAASTSSASGAERLNTPFCELVWEGAAKERCFRNWSMHVCSTEDEAVAHLEAGKAAQYWALLKRHRRTVDDLLES